MTGEEFNHQLAGACQLCKAACCKKGRILLVRSEYLAIQAHLANGDPAALAEFKGRITDHGDFLLYDQQDACQFLDSANLCRLHSIGLKPAECLWWPYHVFVDEKDQLEIRLATWCCDGHQAHGPASPYPLLIEKRVREMGQELIRAFRLRYPGGHATIPVHRIVEAETERAPESPKPGGVTN